MKKVLLLLLAVFLFGCSDNTPTGGAEKLASNLANRVTTRNAYDPEVSLTDQQTKLILEAGFSAPTGVNQRSLEFIVVDDREIMTDLFDEGMNMAFLTASAMFVIVDNTSVTGYPEYIQIDTGLAAMAMVTQATEMGLATVVLSVSPNENKMGLLRTYLGLDNTYNPMLMVAVGTISDSNPDAVSGASVETYNEAQVHYNKLGG